MEDNMYSATMDFITERVNFHGANECSGLLQSVDNFDAAVDALKETLTEEQMSLFNDCENMLADVDGEQCRFYFEVGFADAVRFMFGWREGWKGN
jgi:nucleoid-associated protein YejK